MIHEEALCQVYVLYLYLNISSSKIIKSSGGTTAPVDPVVQGTVDFGGIFFSAKEWLCFVKFFFSYFLGPQHRSLRPLQIYITRIRLAERISPVEGVTGPTNCFLQGGTTKLWLGSV